jgi:phenylalanyl-tRNA synthetase beta chain
MKISLKWLADFFDPSQTKKLGDQADKIRGELPFLGLEVSSYRKLSQGLEGVVVGFVEKAEKHPDADRLRVCQVVLREGDAPVQIVCGAPNVAAGQKVAVAVPGCVLPGDFKIQKSKIRGAESNGMICSESELALRDESEGIMVLPQSAPVGSSVVTALGLNDEVWELELTPDRSDCLSHLGVSREIGRLLGAQPILPKIETLEVNSKNEVSLMSVEVQATDACPAYAGILFEGMENCKSPDWLARRLEILGHRSHGAVVDITNFVLHELGHPLHAFDADKISGSKIIVRYARAGEKLVTLDEVEISLTSEDLVIADLEKPVALAGVMGGLHSAVDEKTKRVFLESALFDPKVIRLAAQRHKIHSDASHRYERGVDPEGVRRSAARAALLFKELCGLKRRGAFVQVENKKHPLLRGASTLNLDLRAFQEVVGLEIASDEVIREFSKVGIPAGLKSPNVVRVEVPSHRLDLTREIDLVEEAARLVGYARIPERFPPMLQSTTSKTQTLSERCDQIRNILAARGLCEMMPYSFISDKERQEVSSHPLVALDNPLTAHWAYMRPSVSFGLLKVAADHVGLGQLRAEFFDVGHCFSKIDKTSEGPKTENAPAEKLRGVRESLHCGFTLMGRALEEHWSYDKKNLERKRGYDFFDAKGILEKLFGELSALDGRWSSTQFVELASARSQPEMMKQASWIPVDLLHPFRSAFLIWPGKGGGQIRGFVGELHPQKRRETLNLPKGLELSAVVAEIQISPDLLEEMNLHRFSSTVTKANPYGKITLSRRVPIVERDLSLIFSKDVVASEIEKSIRKAAGAELFDLQCLDLFVLENEKKSLAYRLLLQGAETLSDDSIQAVVNRVVDDLRKRFNAELRA